MNVSTLARPDLFDNPLGTDGFEFVEFTSEEPERLKGLFEMMGFAAVSRHRSKNVLRLAQGDVNFILNMEPVGQPAAFRAEHGSSANAMAFRVKDAARALELAVERGATPVQGRVGPMELNIPAIEGIGGSNLYLVDRYGAKAIYDVDFRPIEGAPENPSGVGVTYLDHLTHNVHRGQMANWAMTSPCGKIRIPLNESRDEHSQIEEFLKDYRGEGIQHIALGVADIYETVETMGARGVKFQETPDTYYEQLAGRVKDHGENLQRLRADKILLDGAPTQGQGLLLQIFTQNMIGPIFFELIQRKGNEGFGEGNFKALFESIEADQVRRGVLPAKEAQG
jgi:4-hydroxyphenylpyruvate dioxygenase